ncbi:MAG TPA: bifunctional DNA-binding transcriptional regulator/O6-methylguanine-DNA methyltransferase Ada [Chloroflexota bacterium]|nr:bifunctional DNA-binding transcriptional regulator/O6-methylguanine-DNA methyltransferase Ada [Chloroflexota bacterium]
MLEPAPAGAPAPEPLPDFRSDEERWAAVVGRDTRASGAFVYAVKTTRVHCRPGCASRLPRREHVSFFGSSTQAVAAGFRPCKRCRPDLPTPPDPAAEAVARARALIEASERPPMLRELAAALGLSPYYLHRLFARTVGVTPREYAAACRLRRLQAGLQRGDSVTRAIYDAGFGSSSRVYEQAGGLLGMSPAQYRAGGAGQRIRYAVRPVSLGWVLVAATERGLCAVEFGDTPEALGAQLRLRFPGAELREDDAAFTDWVTQVVSLVEAPRQALDLPLDVRGTAFQQRVWRVLREIPPGTTLGYAEVAQRIGLPNATRAVAQACAANPVAVAIPCHRVVRADGGLGGYRWGVERKRALLAREHLD